MPPIPPMPPPGIAALRSFDAGFSLSQKKELEQLRSILTFELNSLSTLSRHKFAVSKRTGRKLLQEDYAPQTHDSSFMNQQTPITAKSVAAVRCGPIPHWVKHEPYTTQTPDSAPCVSNGVGRLLSDTQINLSGPELAWHYRTAQRVLTRAGAERIAQFAVEFNPAFQRLEVHFVRVLRGDECIEHANTGDFQLLRRETHLERLILDGRLTASLLIPDLRVSDILEFGITIYGNHPALDEKYAGWMAFDSFNPSHETRYRMIRPSAREVSLKQFNDPPRCEHSAQDGVENACWRIAGQRRRDAEPFTPPWLIVAPAVQFSEFRSWSEVSQLLSPFYDGSDLPASLASEIDQLRETYDQPADRAVEWLRFVQQKLRYFALALGEGGLVPRDIEAIWSSRFGDCKDAARLYVAGARRMGLDACPALVSTTHGASLNDVLPSVTLFNHCIVRLRLNGNCYWLDPTMQRQSGTLENIFQRHTGWALPLTVKSEGLEHLGTEKPLHLLSCEEDLYLGVKPGSPARFRRQIEYRFGTADMLRNRIANQGSAAFAKEMLNQLQSVWPSVVETEPVVIRDDPEANLLMAIFSYQIRDCWKSEKRRRLKLNVPEHFVWRELGPINGGLRSVDIYLGKPRKVTNHLRIHMPSKWEVAGWDIQCKLPGLTYKTRLTAIRKTIESEKELIIEAWSAPAAYASDYTQAVAKMRQNNLSIGAMRGWFGGLQSVKSYIRVHVYCILIAFLAYFGLFLPLLARR